MLLKSRPQLMPIRNQILHHSGIFGIEVMWPELVQHRVSFKYRPIFCQHFPILCIVVNASFDLVDRVYG